MHGPATKYMELVIGLEARARSRLGPYHNIVVNPRRQCLVTVTVIIIISTSLGQVVEIFLPSISNTCMGWLSDRLQLRHCV